MQGKLFLIPTPIWKGAFEEILPVYIGKTISELSYFIVENEKSARHFIKKICPEKPQHHLKFFELSKPNKKLQNISTYLFDPIFRGHSMGLLSEAGLPCIADPGSDIVLKAHSQKLTVVPLSGPSSIFMALMASGLSGQQFAFHGYLPIAKDLLKKKIKSLEKHSRKIKQTQIFMETPYRNKNLLEMLLCTCDEDSWLTIAIEITGLNETIKTKSISKWKEISIDLHKRPSLFALFAYS